MTKDGDMASKIDDGRVWGRPEALDTLGRVPGRRGRTAAGAFGIAAIAVGAYLAFSGPANGQDRPPPVTALLVQTPAGGPAAAPETCTSIGLDLPANRIPAEGIQEGSVTRLSRVDADGSARLLVPQAYVLKVADGDRGGLRLSVLVRSGSTVDATGSDPVDQINGANADGSLAAAILYDVESQRVLDECRGVK
jgi:hypothetical protein